MSERMLLRVTEAAEALSLSRSKTYELIQSGELPSVRIGRATRVPVGALRTWVEAGLTAAAESRENPPGLGTRDGITRHLTGSSLDQGREEPAARLHDVMDAS